MRNTFVILFLCFGSGLWAQGYSVNKVNMNEALDTANEYQFLISGHFYGDGFNQTHYPANTVLGNIELFNNMDFSICLGDLYRDVKYDHPFYQNSFYKQLTKPLYNAVGNHDISGNFFEEQVAPTYFSFSTKGIRHVILNTELNDSRIIGEQLDSFKVWLNDFKEDTHQHLFIYTHRPIWAEEDSVLITVFSDNTQSDFGTNFQSEIIPLLNSIPNDKSIFWFSGSMGAQPHSFFYFPKNNITYAITAVRGIKRDAVLLVNFENEKLSFQTKSLTGEQLMDFEDYNLELFLNHKEPMDINYRLIPLWIKNTLFHRYFWYGVLFSLISIFVVIKLTSRFR